MRLTPEARDTIRQTTKSVFGQQARVSLFGSRTDDRLKGGDIDLLIELPRPASDKQQKILTLVARLQRTLGERSIDVIVLDPQTPRQPIHTVAQQTGQPV